MTGALLVAVPIKPFGVAKARLAPRVGREARARLGRAVAAHTVAVASRHAAEVAVVTGDAAVAGWAHDLGASVVPETGPGLDAAAAAAVGYARDRGMAWAVFHADLPLLRDADVAEIAGRAAGGRPVLAPARDGGTNVIAGTGKFAFSYGVGSFRRHLRQAAPLHPVVVARTGTAVDLDTVADVDRVCAHPAGAWIGRYLT